MDEQKLTPAESTPANAVATAPVSAPDLEDLARGSGTITNVPEVPVLARARTEDSVMEGLPLAKIERIAAMRRELADLQRQLTEAQQRIATELQGRADDAERFETLEEELRLELAAREAQLATKSTALDDARTLLETRDVELGTVKADRDALKRENDQIRAKAREIGNQIVQFGQGLLDGRASEPTAPIARPQPPPLPRPKVEAPSPPPVVETILEVVEEPAPRGAGRWLLPLGAALFGCVATLAYVKVTAADAPSASQAISATSEPTPVPAPSAAPIEAQVAAPVASPVAAPAAPLAPLAPPAPPAPPAATSEPQPVNAAARAATSADGTLVLPPSAAGHRVFVDDRIIEIKDSRATVRCGSHVVRIGSQGTARTLDVLCGGETPIPADEQP